ncbi:U2 snRNP-associated SURP motif-containing protein isoform X2 [Brevipalpus obovatus]|uniref:U2 snRNP-associated SURP motif-containing protein isoform X2 n=1 Tax=Brevipalpus obovatus TaxID=246614 RepID=UPI003D9F2E76
MTSKKELERQKKQLEEQAAAEVFKEFVETFEKPSGSSKVFVLGSVINSGHEEEKDSTKVYKPSKLQELVDKKKKRTDHISSSLGSEKSKLEKLGKKKEKEKKKSNLELFKEELRQIQEEREERHRLKSLMKKDGKDFEPPPKIAPSFGSYDTGDPNTTNIYLGNINPKMTEQQLMENFGKYGPLASVKIMWPRSDEERARNRNCGFVAFMNRKDGERAMRALNGKFVMGYEMKLGWGKAVPIPSHPIYIPPKLLELTLPPPPMGLPFNAQPDPQDIKRLPEKGKPYTEMSQQEKEEFEKILSRASVKVIIPTDRHLRCLIHRTIEFVVREGPMFEAMIMNREISNPMFRFLFDNQSPAHIYYRWRLYSVLQGEHPSKWRTDDFRPFKGGCIWKPPPLNLYTQGMPDHLVEESTELEESDSQYRWRKSTTSDKESSSKDNKDSKDSKKGVLTDSQREKLEEILRNLTPERAKISEAMVFCIDHADAAEEVVECIAESLSLSETPLHKKIARLYLISDILHNCCVKVANASYYRKGFQSRLLKIFSDIRDCFTAIDGRLKAEQFKQRIMNCFKTWEEWAIYTSDYLIKLQNTFLGLAPKEPSLERDICDNEDVDGIPVDESDIDGIPIDNVEGFFFASNNVGSENSAPPPKFKPSKWETVDPDAIEAQAMSISKWDALEKDDREDNSGEKSIDVSPHQNSGDDSRGSLFLEQLKKELSGNEGRRAKLRELEVKVLKFQDELESGKKSRKHGVSIQEQVEEYRDRLLRKYTDSPSSSPSSSHRDDSEIASNVDNSSYHKNHSTPSTPSSHSAQTSSRHRHKSRRSRSRSKSRSRSPHERSRKSRRSSPETSKYRHRSPRKSDRSPHYRSRRRD